MLSRRRIRQKMRNDRAKEEFKNLRRERRKKFDCHKPLFPSVMEYLEAIENSKSNRARCNECKKLIGKNTIRGVFIVEGEKNKRTLLMRLYVCSDCALKRLNKNLKYTRTARNTLKRKMRTRKVAYEKQETLRNKEAILMELEEEGK
jgi:hypothetical protein